MPTSSAVRTFIESLPNRELYTDVLRDLAREAKRLAREEPHFAAQFTLIRQGFAELANHWDDVPLSPRVSQVVTPRVLAAVKGALEAPGLETLNELAGALDAGMDYQLLSDS